MRAILLSLRVRFLILALLAVLPALGLLLYTVDEQRDQAIDKAQVEMRRLAGLAATDQSRLIDSTRQLLIVLAKLPEVHSLDPTQCSALMRELLPDYPLYANLGAIKPNGEIYCSAVETPEGANLGGRAYFLQAREGRDFAVSDYQISIIDGETRFTSAYPVIDEAGDVVAVVFAALSLEWLDQTLAKTEFQEGTVLTVVDRDGMVLLRHPDGEISRGQSLRADAVIGEMFVHGRGVTEAPNEDGQTYLYAYAPLEVATAPYAYLSLGIPRASAIAAADQAFDDNLTWLGLVTALALVAAWIGGDLLAPRDTEANKALVRRVYEAFRLGNVDQLDEVVAADFVDHDPMPGQMPGLVGLKQAVGLFRAAFPDGQLTVEELIAEGNKVVARVTLRGTQCGEFSGLPPSGVMMGTDGVETYQIRRGKIVESWSRFGGLTPLVDGQEAVPAADQELQREVAETNGRTSSAWWRRRAEVARSLRNVVGRRQT